MAKTPAQRKAEERKRRRDSGEVLVQVWATKTTAPKIKEYALALRVKHVA